MRWLLPRALALRAYSKKNKQTEFRGAQVPSEPLSPPETSRPLRWTTAAHISGRRECHGGRVARSSHLKAGLALCVALLSASPAAFSQNLIGAYNFDEGAGTTLNDSSGNGRNGTLTNGPVWSTGRYGSALQFNASDDGNDDNDPRVVLGTSFDIPNLPLTISAWVNPINYDDWRAIISKRDATAASEMRLDFSLMQGSGQVYVFNGSVIPFSYAPPLNTWTHLALVADSSGTQLYVNGVLQETLDVITLGTKSTANTVIGGTGEGSGGDNDPFNGKIDDLRVYGRALTQAEIEADMNTPVGSGSGDTTPPTLSDGQPIGSLAFGTTQSTLSVTTNENATCRYGTVPGTTYASMTGTFTTTGATSHSTLVTGLTNEQSYTYYVRCQDGAANANGSDYLISFSIAGDTTPPVLSNGQPSGSLPASTTQTTLGVTTSESATCRYGTVPGTAYGSMTNTFATTGGTSHGTQVSGLTSGQTYTYYVRCQDGSLNANGADYSIGFSVSGDTQPQGPFQYLYDESGRLIGVLTANGQSAYYDYDAAGNIVAIRRVGEGVVAIGEFTPNSATVGATVTIWGSGFSATAAQNVVRFNGTTASVASATANKLVVTVPGGATTGPISVTSPSGSATSAASFVVLANSGVPTISGFTPTIGKGGMAVTITGANFEPLPANNRVRLNQAFMLLTGATTTSISAQVPASVSSGRINVATPLGNATSAADFFVVPGAYQVSDVAFTSRTTIGAAPQSYSIGSLNRIGLIVFDGTRSAGLSIVLTNVSMGGSLVVYRPDGVQHYSTTIANNVALDVPTLPMDGTYQIMLVAATAAGSATLHLLPDATATLVVDGAPSVLSLASNQNGRYTFAGTVGGPLPGWMTIGVSSFAVTPTNSYGWVQLQVLKPDGTQLVDCGRMHVYQGPNSCSIERLTAAGNYTVVITQPDFQAANLTLTVSNMVNGGAIAPNGAAVTYSTSRAGQRAIYTFSGTAGQDHELTWSDDWTFPGTLNLPPHSSRIIVYRPDGTELTSSYITVATIPSIQLSNLPATGTYTVGVMPIGGTTGRVTMQLFQRPADATLNVDGASTTVNLASLQTGRYTFAGTVGGRWPGWMTIGVSIFGVAPTNTSGWVRLQILKPDGTQLVDCGTMYRVHGSNSCSIGPLMAAGSYTVVITQPASQVVNLTLTVSNMVDGGAITPNGAAVTFSTSRMGQRAIYTFTGTAGQNHVLTWSGATFLYRGNLSPSSSRIIVYRPGGAELATGYMSAQYNPSGSIQLTNLPATGTYTVGVVPTGGETGQVTMQLTQ